VESSYREAGEVILETAPPRRRRGAERLRFCPAIECKNCAFRMRGRARLFFLQPIPMGPVRAAEDFGNTIDFDMDLVIPDQSKTPGRGRD